MNGTLKRTSTQFTEQENDWQKIKGVGQLL